MPNTSVRMANNASQYDYLTYGHIPKKKIKFKVISKKK